jgi:2-dehydro-3-deoxygluconokinase
VSQLLPGEVDWRAIFEEEGARWLHTGGIFAGLSEGAADVAEEAMRAARAAGIVVSYDLNYRPSLWQRVGGAERAAKVNRRLAAEVDVMFGNEEDFGSALGYEIVGVNDAFSALEAESYVAMMEAVVRDYPNLKMVATSLRTVKTATVNDWGGGICYAGGQVYVAEVRRDVEILDRVGGGDSFASGLIYGLLAGLDVTEALAYGVAHGALAMTTPGDTSKATLSEVTQLVGGGHARVQR